MSMEDNNQEIDDNDDETVQYVKLVSAEGYEFFVDRQIAIASSTTIRTMLSGSFLEGKENIIRLPDMAGYILERLVRYMHYKAQYSNSTSRIPEFVRKIRISEVCYLYQSPRSNMLNVFSLSVPFHIGHRTGGGVRIIAGC